MAEQFSASVYQQVSYPGGNVVPGGPSYNSTPVATPFPSASVRIHPKTNFERFFIQKPSVQVEPAFWTAINSVVEDPESGTISSCTQSVVDLITAANA